MKTVVIIGGGIIGLSSAWFLRQAGHTVTVLEKGYFTDNCSWGNAGYVCPGHFIPLATPRIVRQGLRWMLDAKSPFYVRPSLNPSLLDWGWHFIRSATKENTERAAVPLRDIALLSQREYEKWSASPDFDFGYRQDGLLEIFQTAATAEHARHTVEKGLALGLDVEMLTGAALGVLEPETRINGLGAIFFKGDAHLSPDKLMTGLLRRLKAQGVRLLEGHAVTGFEKKGNQVTKAMTATRDFDGDEFVVASGSWSRETAALLDTRIPLMPGRGYSVTVSRPAFRLRHPAILSEGRVAATPFGDGRIRFGGTMEVVPTGSAPRYQRVDGILRSVKDFFPDYHLCRPADKDIWFGYRPCSADGLPYIGRISRFTNVVVATGHAMLGLSLGAGTGKLVSGIVAGEPPEIPLAPFAVERFGR